MKKLFFIFNYFIFKLKASNEHGVHSPFVFHLLTNVIYNKNEYYCFKNIANLKLQFVSSKNIFNWVKNKFSLPNNTLGKNYSESDFRLINNTNQIYCHNKYSVKYSKLLFRLVNHFQPEHIIEIGTSFSIHSIYLASACSKTSLITIEQNAEIADVTKDKFKKINLINIEQKFGNIPTSIFEIFSRFSTLNFVCFNRGFCASETLNYFTLCLEKVSKDSIFVFCDIYASSSNKELWNTIKNNNRVSVTIDFFFMGIVFFHKEQAKQNFRIKF